MATSSPSNQQWRPPPLDCPHLIEGRRLFKERQYAEASIAFRTGLDQLVLAPPKEITSSSDDDNNVWTADEIMLSTRLFLLNALWRASEGQSQRQPQYAYEALREAQILLSEISAAECQCRPSFLVIICQAIGNMAKDVILKDDDTSTSTGDRGQIASMGIAACRRILDSSEYGTPKQRRLFYELESNLSEQNGNLEAAVASTEALLVESPNNQAQRKRLRDLRIRLGLIDEISERAAAEAEAERLNVQRDHSKRKRQRRKFRQSARLGERLAELAPDVEATLNGPCAYAFFDGLTIDAAKREPSRTIDWSSIPDELTPDSSIRNKKVMRVRRKQLQLEALYVLLRDLIDTVVASKVVRNNTRPLHIVDFGSGSGNSCLVFAWLLRDVPCRFTSVDVNPQSVLLGKKRTSEAGLESTVSWVCGDVADFHDSFDIGLATHLCGGATDLAIHRCLGAKAAFLATPCCLGAIQFAININKRTERSDAGGNVLKYPRSQWLRDRLSVEEYAEMTQLGDCTAAAGEEAGNELRMEGKALLDADRLRLAREAGYETAFGRLGSKAECGPKSDVLCGMFR